MVHGIERQAIALGGIGAHIRKEARVDAGDDAVLAEADLHLVALLAVVAARLEILAPALDPLHRASQAKRREGDQRLFRVRRALGAEAAADVGREHADLLGGHADDARDGVPDRVRVLRGRPEDEPAGVRIAIGQRAARLDEHRGEARVAEVLAHDHVGGG